MTYFFLQKKEKKTSDDVNALKRKKNQNISFIQKENKIKQRAFFPSMTSFAQENINILPKIN
jgi:hypothetical protein